MENKKISVIVPVYNVEKYLRRCIDSIIGQNYDNMEIILVDDGSTDSSGKICDDYGRSDTRIIVIHKDNGGLSSARNAGIKIATGEYLCFVDSDDYVDKNILQKLISTALKNDADMCLCDFEYVYENADICKLIKQSLGERQAISEKEYWHEFAVSGNPVYIVAWNKLYKRYIFEDVRYPEGLLHEDEAVIHKIVEKCKKISIISDRLYYYVQRENSITNKNIAIENLCYINFVYDRIMYFKEKEMYVVMGYVCSTGIDQLYKFYSQKNELNKKEKIIIMEYCKKLKTVSKLVFKNKETLMRDKMKAFVFWFGGINFYNFIVRIKRKINNG